MNATTGAQGRRAGSRIWWTTLLLAALTLPAAANDALTLRVNDVKVRPGGTLAVVLRTYEPRPVGQGQVCFRLLAGPGGGELPLQGVEGTMVFSDADPPLVSSSFDSAQQSLLVSFFSVSASVNNSDGPMAALIFEVSQELVPGTDFILELDAPATNLIDENGDPITIALRAGDLTVLDPSAPVALEAGDLQGTPGGVAVVGVGTNESLPLIGGRVVLVYDPALVGGVPQVTMDPRYGTSTFTVDTATPGRISIAFSSPDASLNRVPGDFISVALPLAPDAPAGTSSLHLDPTVTFFTVPGGAPVDLELVDGVIEILALGTIFADGFEGGDLDLWTTVTP